jgi:hypothetical protein
VDTSSNVRRVFGSRRIHLDEEPPPAKVGVVGDHLDAIGLDTEVTRVDADVRVESAFRKLLDCDVVICATDTHGSRAGHQRPGQHLPAAGDRRWRPRRRAS